MIPNEIAANNSFKDLRHFLGGMRLSQFFLSSINLALGILFLSFLLVDVLLWEWSCWLSSFNSIFVVESGRTFSVGTSWTFFFLSLGTSSQRLLLKSPVCFLDRDDWGINDLRGINDIRNCVYILKRNYFIILSSINNIWHNIIALIEIHPFYFT